MPRSQFWADRGALQGLPVPRPWRDDVQRFRWWLFVIYVPFTMLFVSLLVLDLVDVVTTRSVDVEAVFVSAVLSGIFAPSLLIIGWINTRSRRRAPVVELVDGGGLRFSGARFPWVMRLVLAAMALGGGVVGGWIALQRPSGGEEHNWGLVFAVASTLVGGWVLGRAVIGHSRPNELWVTTEGITHQRPAAVFRLLWEDVDVVRLSGRAQDPLGASVRHEGRHPVTADLPVILISARPSRWATRIDVGPEVRMTSTTAFHMTVFVDALECDPVVVAHAVAWYALNPGDREELADGRARLRVLEGRAVVELDEA